MLEMINVTTFGILDIFFLSDLLRVASDWEKVRRTKVTRETVAFGTFISSKVSEN